MPDLGNSFKSLKELVPAAYGIVGRQNAQWFVAYMALAGMLQAAVRALPDVFGSGTVKQVLDILTLVCIVIGVMYLAIGLVLNPAAAESHKNMPLEGLIAGLLAGLIAAATGGATYYLLNVQQCPTADAVVKFMRLLPNCAVVGAFLGAVAGLFPPFRTPAPAPVPPPPRDPEAAAARAGHFVGSMILLGVLLIGIVWVDRSPTQMFGEAMAGKVQGNIVYWQYLSIVGSYALALLVLTKWRLGWNSEGRGTARALCDTLTRGLIVTAASGGVLAVLFGNRDIEPRIGRTGPDACSQAYWADASALDVAFRIIVLLVWLALVLLAVYRRSLPPIDRLVKPICGSADGEPDLTG